MKKTKFVPSSIPTEIPLDNAFFCADCEAVVTLLRDGTCARCKSAGVSSMARVLNRTVKPKVRYYDPPEGWRYGFPKVYTPKKDESFPDVLLRDGYPEKLVPLAMHATRFWEE